jgi:hypothetical protein
MKEYTQHKNQMTLEGSCNKKRKSHCESLDLPEQKKSKQMSIDSVLTKKQYAIIPAKELEKILISYIANDMHPLSVVEGEGFRNLVHCE